jgi:MFS family permease
MAPEPLDVAEAQNRRARIAVAALFLSNGAVFANLLPRYPEIKTDLHLSNAVYGAAIAAFSGGALVAGLAAATLIRRYRSSRVAVVGTIGIGAFVLVWGRATTPLALAAALCIAAACDAITDVAQNAHGLRLQRNYGRSIINSFHAVWAAGAILGGLMGAAAIALHISRATHLAIAAAVFGAVVVVAYPYLLRGSDHEEHPLARAGGGAGAGTAVYATLLVLVVIAVAGATVEDAGSSWATLYLRDSLGAPGAVAVFGYVALVAFMFVGRLIGDRLVDKFGERAVVSAGGFLTAAGGACPGFARAVGSIPCTGGTS